MFVLKYNENKTLPSEVDAYQRKDRFLCDCLCLLKNMVFVVSEDDDEDDACLETLVKPKLQLFLNDYMLNAFRTLFEGDNDVSSDRLSVA